MGDYTHLSITDRRRLSLFIEMGQLSSSCSMILSENKIYRKIASIRLTPESS